MSTDEKTKKPRAPRRAEHEVLRDLELRVLRGKNKATLKAIEKLDRAYVAFGEVVLAAKGQERVCEAIDTSDVGAGLMSLRAALVALLPEAIQPKPDEEASS